jgi:hypothetical protein
MQKRMGLRRGAPGRFASAGTRGLIALLSFIALLALLAVTPAQASFHLIKVREVFPGTVARPDSGYVELQMYSSGQNLVQLGEIEVFNSAGTVTNMFTPASSVANFANQSTVLIADTEFSSQFPGLNADFTDSGLNLNPAGGAVCWPQTEPPFDDCASWGNFTGQASLPSPGDSAPAVPSGIPNGMAIRRTIAPGCPTLLENADDSNDSAVDFSSVSPAPRNNAAVPTEHECTAPNTVIDTKPANPTKATAASFTYHAVPATGASFECKLDLGTFSTCPAAGTSYPGPLVEGSHTFEVRAVSELVPDPTPATYTWKVDTTAPSATIKTHPADPSAGNSASFTYQSNEVGSTFECSLSSGGTDNFAACVSTGKTYSGLADGSYVFKVRATDQAGNQQATPAEFSWQVDNSLADTTPPETTILSRPADPSDSSTASFTYASNEAESSFECSLDGAVFSACPTAGITYTGLGSGPHSFQVKAIDPNHNADPSPAGYSFAIELGSSSPAPLSPAPALPGPSSPTTPPDTKIAAKPSARTRDRTPTFRFRATAIEAKFQCKLDRGRFRPCGSSFTTKTLSFGAHVLLVRAVAEGGSDPSPAEFKFKVVQR